MSIFIVLSKTDNTEIETAILQTFPDKNYKISAGQWMISAEGTAKQISEKLGITEKQSGPSPAIILTVSGYWGRWASELWEWIENNWEKTDG